MISAPLSSLDKLRHTLATFHFSASLGIVLSCLLVFVLQGSIQTFIQPPLQAPDEIQHWLSANRRIEEVTKTCPAYRRVHILLESSRIAFHPDQKFSYRLLFQDFPRNFFRNACPELAPGIIPYGNIFTYPGVLLAKTLLPKSDRSLRNAVTALYASRLFHGIFVAASFALLIALLPANILGSAARLLITPLLLSPLFIQQSFAVSADPITFIGVIALIIATLKSGNTKYLIGAALVGLIAVHTRPPLLPAIGPACLSILFFNSFSWRRKIGTVLLFVTTFALVAWLATQSAVATTTSTQSPTGWEINPSKQMEHIQNHPSDTAEVFYHTMQNYIRIPSFISSLGWLDTHMPREIVSYISTLIEWLMVFGTLFFLAGSFLYIKRYGTLALFFSVSLLTIACLCVTPVITMYLMWTPPAANSVLGVQARYFFPAYLSLLFLPVGIIASNYLIQSSEQKIQKHWWLTCLAGTLFAAITIPNTCRVIIVLMNRYLA